MLKNYLLNPDFLLNVLYLTVFLFIAYKVLGATLWSNIQKKINPWGQSHEKDFDQLIKRKMDLLRANSGLYVPENESPTSAAMRRAKNPEKSKSSHIPIQFKSIHEDLSWGTGEEVKKILKLFQREFNYTPNESNLREHLKRFIEERSIVEAIHQNSKEEIITLLYNRMLLNYYLLEIAENRFNLIKKISIRLNIPSDLFAYSLQYAMLNDDQLPKSFSLHRFSSQLFWGQFKNTEQNEIVNLFLIKAAPLLGKSANSLNDLIRTHFTIADFIRPWNEISKENELEDALLILRAHHSFSFEDIRKNYKKIAQEKHPDKIASLNLPKEIENKASKQFQIVQKAMEIVQKAKG